MESEKRILARKCAAEIDAKLQAKQDRLPKSIQIKIRRMKETGTWDSGIKFREEFLKQKHHTRVEVASEELNKTLAEVICTDDPLIQATGEVKIVWLLSAVDNLSTDERKAEILEILNSKPEPIQGELERQLPVIRNWAKQYLPSLPLAG